jgi:hypothetical protein
VISPRFLGAWSSPSSNSPKCSWKIVPTGLHILLFRYLFGLASFPSLPFLFPFPFPFSTTFLLICSCPSSLQRLVVLLQLDDLEVVEASLLVALILVQRVKGPKAQKFSDLDQTLLVLSQNFGLKTPEQHIRLFTLPREEA